MVESLGSARLLLLVNYRPEYQHGWGSKTYYSQIRLDALPAESTGELLDALLGDDPALAPLKQLLVKRGNPFFLKKRSGRWWRRRRWRVSQDTIDLTRPVEAIQVPATVQAMLAARIDRLPSEDKRLLQVASVIGKDVPFALLQAIAELPDEALRSALDHLQAAEFVYETGLLPDLEYSFKHALTHEVAYGGPCCRSAAASFTRGSSRQSKRCYHESPWRADRAARPSRPTGELREKAVSYLRQAGPEAGARSALRMPGRLVRAGACVLDTLPETESTLEQSFDIRLELRHMLFQLGEFRRGTGAPARGRGPRGAVERRPSARPGLRLP